MGFHVQHNHATCCGIAFYDRDDFVVAVQETESVLVICFLLKRLHYFRFHFRFVVVAVVVVVRVIGSEYD